jgi:hypothetical protein
VTAPRRQPASGREDAADEPKAWPPASEEWFATLLADAPPLSERQRNRLRELLDLSGKEPGHDAA